MMGVYVLKDLEGFFTVEDFLNSNKNTSGCDCGDDCCDCTDLKVKREKVEIVWAHDGRVEKIERAVHKIKIADGLISIVEFMDDATGKFRFRYIPINQLREFFYEVTETEVPEYKECHHKDEKNNKKSFADLVLEMSQMKTSDESDEYEAILLSLIDGSMVGSAIIDAFSTEDALFSAIKHFKSTMFCDRIDISFNEFLSKYSVAVRKCLE
jgi:hypothetical protein